jgi:hypothetical protein
MSREIVATRLKPPPTFRRGVDLGKQWIETQTRIRIVVRRTHFLAGAKQGAAAIGESRPPPVAARSFHSR